MPLRLPAPRRRPASSCGARVARWCPALLAVSAAVTLVGGVAILSGTLGGVEGALPCYGALCIGRARRARRASAVVDVPGRFGLPDDDNDGAWDPLLVCAVAEGPGATVVSYDGGPPTACARDDVGDDGCCDGAGAGAGSAAGGGGVANGGADGGLAAVCAGGGGAVDRASGARAGGWSWCNATRECCDDYAACVGCCLQPNRAPLREALQAAMVSESAAQPVYRVLAGRRLAGVALPPPAVDAFAFCGARCRASGASTWRENAYRGALKHCYGILRPPRDADGD